MRRHGSVGRAWWVGVVLVMLLGGPGCGTGEVSRESDDIGPGPGVLLLSHGGGAWSGSLPLWSVWANGVLVADGSNLPQDSPIRISLPGVPEGSEVIAYGFDTFGGQITSAQGFLGPMGMVLQMY
jgi:hypothetical protein